MRRPIEVVVLNCWVTETNETPCASNSSISLAKSERAGQAVDLVDDHDLDFPSTDVGEEALQRRPVERATGIAAVIVMGRQRPPAFMPLALGCRRASAKPSVTSSAASHPSTLYLRRR
jgi:hypothetical protein